LLLLLLVGSAAMVAVYPEPKVRFEQWSIPSTSGRPIRAVFVLPHFDAEPPPKSAPAVIAIPPYSIPPEAMEIICVELASRGAVCAIPDFFGKTPEESRQNMGKNSLEVMTRDMHAIAARLRSLAFVDPKRLGACGHSVGGTVTVLLGLSDPLLLASVPIGMESAFNDKRPKNLLFLSGLYDEIHAPSSLKENLAFQMGIKDAEIGRLYGSFEDGSARKVSIMPTTDHFIETFDPFLIRELLDWYANALSEPGLSEGHLIAWRHRVGSFLLMVSLAILWAVLAGRVSAGIARKLAASYPGWIVMRVQAFPLVAVLAAVWMAGDVLTSLRPLATSLLVALLLAQELASHRARGVLRYGERSPYRNMFSAFMVLVLLGACTLVSFGIMSVHYYGRYPSWLAWYPVFAANMALLFPLEVWGRSSSWFFDKYSEGILASGLWWALAAVVVIFPGQLARGADRIATEMVVTVRSRLRPLGRLREAKAKNREIEVPPSRTSPLKVAVLALLVVLLLYLSYRRINEGMLTTETALLALQSIIKFAVLPFVLAALVVRTVLFRKMSGLD